MTKILVVDDSVSVRDVVERALTSREIEVVSVGSGSEAIERIEREHPDLVVCDVLMPERDGFEVCRFVKTHPELGRTPVLLISGTVNSSVLEQAARVHSDDVLGKPFHMNELVRRVTDLLGTDGARPGEMAWDADGSGASGEPAALRAALIELGTLPGVDWAALADGDGFVIESAAGASPAPQAATALGVWLAASSAAIGRELGRGPLHCLTLEYAGGTLLVQTVGSGAVLVLLVRDPGALVEVRYWVRKALPHLARGTAK
jgi:CheY-like chemotaxis protein